MELIKLLRIIFSCTSILLLGQIEASPVPRPDSAGIVEMPSGLAYGGIPYGSVTGMVADFHGANQRLVLQHGRQPLRPVYY